MVIRTVEMAAWQQGSWACAPSVAVTARLIATQRNKLEAPVSPIHGDEAACAFGYDDCAITWCRGLPGMA